MDKTSISGVTGQTWAASNLSYKMLYLQHLLYVTAGVTTFHIFMLARKVNG